MEIRKALPVDEDILVSADKEIIGGEDRRPHIQGAIAEGLCYLAEENRKVMGYAFMHYHFFDNGFIDLLIVHPDHRRRGVGSALMDYCRKVCKTEKMFTSTNRSNTPMQKLLEKAGYLYSGEVNNLDEGDPEWFYIAPPVTE